MPRVRSKGFTLIETAMSTVIIGVGIVAMVDAQQAFIQSNLWSSHAASATFLGNEIRELTRHMPRHDPVGGLTYDEEADTLTGWGPEANEFTVDDFDDIDDFDGMVFAYYGTGGQGNNPGWTDGDLPGPVNAFGRVISDIDNAGLQIIEDGQPVPMEGWAQRVSVVKVYPFDTSRELADRFFEPPAGDFLGRRVDQYPVRVTVEVLFRPADAVDADVIGRVTWIVP